VRHLADARRRSEGDDVNERRYGSDAMVDALVSLGIELVALNPGATTRGLHESLAHARRPEMILALHENIAVAVAEGYARTTQRPMAVMLHDLVGLQNGSMAIFNSWMDCTPMLIIGGSGPADASTRRPWIDWVHSAKQQSLLIRDHVKWTDEPASLPAAMDSMVRGYALATAFPEGPVYVSLDAGLQEAEMPADGAPRIPSVPHFGGTAAGDDELAQLADRLLAAESPVLVADGTGRSRSGYEALRSLAEALGAQVVDLQARHNFSNTHWADATNSQWAAIGEADVVVAVDPRDATYALAKTDTENRRALWVPRPDASVNVITGNPLVSASYVDREPLPASADVVLAADSALALPRLAEMVVAGVSDGHAARVDRLRSEQRPRGAAGASVADPGPDQPISPAVLAERLWEAVRGGPWQLAYGSLYGWVRRTWELTDFNCSLGRSVGGGLGYGAGASIGCALAHRGDDTLVVDIQPDGDLLYTASALWTAAHYRLPLLMVVANNRTYNQDRMHQQVISEHRARPPYDVETGIDITGPDIDFAKLADAQGVEAFGPVESSGELAGVLERAVKIVRTERRPVVVDAVTTRDRS
jgi:thiamine pyrophosphate-dependent acetolactate synthase large subunit-like protein